MTRPHQRSTVEVSNPEKVLFPRDGITKADLAAYYEEIADTTLPHVRDRAMVMHRFPDGIRHEGFIQNLIRSKRSLVDWRERVIHGKTSRDAPAPSTKRSGDSTPR